MRRRGSWKPTLQSNIARYGQSRLTSKAQRKAIKKKLQHVLVQDTPPTPKPNWKDQFIDDVLAGKPVAPTPSPKTREERQHEAYMARCEVERAKNNAHWFELYPRIIQYAVDLHLTLDELADRLESATHFLWYFLPVGCNHWGPISGVQVFPYPKHSPTLHTQRRYMKLLWP